MSGHDELITALERLLADHGRHGAEVRVDRELTAGANRRTVRLIVGLSGAAGGSVDSVGAIAQIVDRDLTRPAVTRAVTDEAAVISLAGRHGVPVPEVLAAGRATELAGAEVLITAEVAGETIPRRVLRSVAAVSGGDRSLTESCGRALVRLHSIDLAELPPGISLPSLAAPSYLDHLTERLDDLPDPHPTFRFAIEQLRRRTPSDPTSPSLVHGDFRNGNLIVAITGNGADGQARLAAALDWELAHIGDPMEDLAWLCLRTWRFGIDHREVGGFGSIDTLRGAYVDGGGQWRQDAFDWWTAARTAWWGIGLAAQAAAFCDGRSESLVHAASGRRVVELEYDLLGLLAPLVD